MERSGCSLGCKISARSLLCTKRPTELHGLINCSHLSFEAVRAKWSSKFPCRPHTPDLIGSSYQQVQPSRKLGFGDDCPLCGTKADPCLSPGSTSDTGATKAAEPPQRLRGLPGLESYRVPFGVRPCAVLLHCYIL